MVRVIPFRCPGLIGKSRSIFLVYFHWFLTGRLHPLFPNPFVPRPKAAPAKRSELGYGDENAPLRSCSQTPIRLTGTFVTLAEKLEKYFKFLKTWIFISLRLKKENTFFTVSA